MDRDAQRPGGPRDAGQCICHCLKCGRSRHRQLVRDAPPDEAEPGDRIIGPLDLVGILFRDHDPKGKHVLGRLAQRRGVDARHRDRAFLAEELPCNGGALGDRHEIRDGGVDRTDTLVQRQGNQVSGRQSQPVQRVGSRSCSGGGLAEAACQILGRLFDARHRHPRQLARALQCLDRRDRCDQRLCQFGLHIHRLQPGADHRSPCSGQRRSGGCGCQRGVTGKGRDTRIGQIHLARQPAKPARPGFPHAFQLGAHLTTAGRHKADGDPFFSHRGVLPSVR